MHILFEGAITDPSGYGEASRNYILSLDKKIDNIAVIGRSFWNGPKMQLGEIASDLARISQKRIPVNETDSIVHIMNLTPENYYYVNKFRASIAMTTFETDGLPQHWLMPMRAMDAIITYTDFNVETFKNAGITNIPIYKIPHGVDVNRFNPDITPFYSGSDFESIFKDNYVFGSNFDWSARKNPEALLTAYFTTFTNKDNVILFLKAYHQFPIHKSIETMQNKIAELRKSLGISKKKAPKVILQADIVSPEDIPSYYTAMDCYVYPTRGEGWSLSTSEAMACGLPVITTNWSGHLEFCNNDNSMLVDYKLVDIDEDIMKERPFYTGQKWADINIEDLSKAMLYAYTNSDKMKAIGGIARADMVKNWTWDIASDKLLKLLNEKLGD